MQNSILLSSHEGLHHRAHRLFLERNIAMNRRHWPLFRRRHALHLDQAPAQQPASPLSVDSRARLINTPYFLPKDAEEDARLNFQHRALYAAMGNHYLAPIKPETDTI